jgi:D-arabinose 1-dehydrogenase-like Zn-dependent alcohol dehydrogenase
MAKNKVAQVGKPGGEFELVEREIAAPSTGEVRIKVFACGVCHSDEGRNVPVDPIPPACRDMKWRA